MTIVVKEGDINQTFCYSNGHEIKLIRWANNDPYAALRIKEFNIFLLVRFLLGFWMVYAVYCH